MLKRDFERSFEDNSLHCVLTHDEVCCKSVLVVSVLCRTYQLENLKLLPITQQYSRQQSKDWNNDICALSLLESSCSVARYLLFQSCLGAWIRADLLPRHCSAGMESWRASGSRRCRLLSMWEHELTRIHEYTSTLLVRIFVSVVTIVRAGVSLAPHMALRKNWVTDKRRSEFCMCSEIWGRLERGSRDTLFESFGRKLCTVLTADRSYC